MEERNASIAFEIIGKLLSSEDVGEKTDNISLYESYNSNMEVYDLVNAFMKNMSLKIYEYNNSLYVCPLESGKIFGYTNENLRDKIGLKVNKELYLGFFVTYIMAKDFLTDKTDTGDYVRVEDVIESVDNVIPRIIDKSLGVIVDDDYNSIRSLALMWDEMPLSSQNEVAGKAARGSKTGFVKLLLNFYVGEKLFVQNEDRYYATGRFFAIGRGYFDEHRNQLMDVLVHGE